jgi:murein DD-endopeptidase MepM/ murein hydrolase activator NlpD
VGQPDPSAKPADTVVVNHYVVKWGDSLFGIAVSYGVPMQSLIEANKLDNPDRIYAGQTLAIPWVSADGGLAISTAQTLSQPASESGFIWPVPLEEGWIPKWYRLDHPGIDIILTEGTQIRAAAAGTIEFSGWNNQGFGNLVVIDHGNGYRTLYAHQSERLVVEGQTVAQGDVVGLVGMTGNATDPHLHFEIRVGYDPVNPCDYLPGGCLK